MQKSATVPISALALLTVSLLAGGCGCARSRLFPPVGYPATVAGPVSSVSTLKDYRTARVSSEERDTNRDFRRIEPRATLVLADLQGPGEVTHMWTTIASPDPHHLRNLVLRVFYDGNVYPSVESPIGDFYGLGNGKSYTFNNLMQAIGTNNGLNSLWPMPFAKSARFEVTNESDIPVGAFYYYVDWRQFKRMPRGVGYFHAQYRQAMPCPDGQSYRILETQGSRGHFVGCNLSIHTQVSGWWGEGDDIFTVDGETIPSLWGTGSEDYFAGAWGFGETFYNDYFGMPYRERLDQNPDNFWNVYRLHIENPVAFRKSIKVEIEHGASGFDNTRAGGKNNDYSSVAYWYMKEPTPLIGQLPPAAERIPNYRGPKVPENAIEMQKVLWSADPGEGVGVAGQELSTFTAQTGAKWLFDDHVFCHPNVDGSRVTGRFDVKKEMKGDLVFRFTQAPDYARVRVSLDDKVIVPDLDLYHPQVRAALVRAASIELRPGSHTLTIETMGKNPKSENCLWGIDYLRVGGEPLDIEADTPDITTGAVSN